MQADGKRDMELNHNRGDAGDSYPGSTNNKTFSDTSTPNSKSYAGSNTCVKVSNISDPAAIMHADLAVKCVVKVKENLNKEIIKEKEFRKEFKNEKIEIKEIEKNHITEKASAHDKLLIEHKLGDGKFTDGKLGEGGGFGRMASSSGTQPGSLESRIAQLEAILGQIQPFIEQSLRPDLSQGALSGEEPEAEV